MSNDTKFRYDWSSMTEGFDREILTETYPCQCADCPKCADCPDGCEEIVTNEQGGQNSRIVGRYDLLPPLAIAELAQVLEHGAEKYEDDNWKLVPIMDHMNHALSHIFSYLFSKKEEDLAHAMTRVVMAMQLVKEGSEVG